MGRNGMSWAKIGTFYIFFYSFLAGFFAINMYVMLQTLDEKVPTVVGRSNKPQIALPRYAATKMDFNSEEEFEKYKTALNKTAEDYDGYTAPENDDSSTLF